MIEQLKSMISENENIFWEGKPDKKCFIFETIFNPLMPFAIIWAIIDFGILGAVAFGAGEQDNILLFLIPFFALHLMPVWLYLGGVLLCTIRYKNTYYIVTDKAIYISGGIINKSFRTKPFAKMSHINLHRGLFDQIFKVGDVICTSNETDSNGVPATMVIGSIKNYTEVFNKIKKLQEDVYTDVMYPNDLRPKENHGYNTEYKG